MKIEMDIDKKYKALNIVIQSPELNQEVTDIITKLETPTSFPISGKCKDKIYVLHPEDIYLFYSLRGKVFADSKSSSYEIKQKLYEVEESLTGKSFIRISKSAIVNIYKIKNIELSFSGSLIVKFDNGHDEIISRRFAGKVKEFIGLGGK
jgi:DNA-binding LytR/AlgR family response regulator